eukprot:CAMPEP_0118922732 /NCGR_PEP_ID=MMETSP1169-20130426/1560_1 /TAXON_ID=36882 /ORGANISM="Pyramimonas obovata, Strain CCMP722" /LENGTH=133 /DNA_ID=CAMNT_0006863651 /DNA_START=383 /DNA_END=784 /DNA_ORIENTATION=+
MTDAKPPSAQESTLPGPPEDGAASQTQSDHTSQPGGAGQAEGTPQRSTGSVVVLFKATGGAPILKQSKFKIQGSEKFSKAVDFLRKLIHRDSLFVYLNSAFAPSMDELISTLYESYGLEGKLVVNYSITPAWG